MNILKKIISFIVILTFLGTNIGLVNANFGPLYKDIILTRNELKEIKNGSNYIKQIENLVEKYENDEKILQKLETKTDNLILKLEKENSTEYKDVLIIIKFLNSRTKLAKEILTSKSTDELIKENDEKILNEIEIKQEEMLNLTLPESETKKVNEKLVEIQLNLFNRGVDKLKFITEEFEKLSNYEEKGDFKMNLDFKQESIGKINALFNFVDYTITASNFDSQIKGQINTNINTNLNYEDNIKFELSSFVDFISKDGNMYLLLEKLNITQENIEYITGMIEQLKEIAKQNKYIKFDDQNSQAALMILNSLTPNKILADGKAILEKPMFRAYKKDGDKYYLVPTKYACDKTKELLNKFDPFNPSSCTDSQYKSMINNLAEVGEIYMKIGNNTTIGFEGISDSQIEKLEGYITFSDTEIEEINFYITPNQKKYPNEFLKIEYIKNNKLDFGLYADKGEIDFKLSSILNNNNNFSYINFHGNIITKYNEFYSNLILENQRISGNFKYYPGKYDWEIGKYIRDDIISGDITGNTNYNNKLENLGITYNGENKESGKYLTGEISLKNSIYSFVNNFNNDKLKSDINLSWTWDNFEKVITSLDYNLVLSEKQMEWDDINYKYIYSGDFKDIVNSNLKLNNKIISGKTIIYNKGDEIINISHSGKFEKNYLEFNNSYELKGEIINEFNNERKYYENKDSEIEEIKKINGKFNIEIDKKYNQNNINIYFILNINGDEIINFELNNESKIEYKEIKIIAPNKENTIDSDEIFDNSGYYYY